jgi:DNA helicase-2/ATP-dependent DNA helicase PcrA
VFADYISNVLPQLGEEQIPETNMEELASDLLDKKVAFQTFFQQVAQLLDRPHPEFIERVKFKASFEFVKQLNRYFVHLENSAVTHIELKVAGVVVPVPFISEKFKSRQRMPMHKRVPEVVQEVLQFVRREARRKLAGGEIDRVKEVVARVLNVRSAFEVYQQFYKWIGKPEMLRISHGGRLEFADVFPLIYCKIRLEGVQTYDHIKHLLVDEMQDYTPVQYAVLSRIFKCKKTILGDINQSVNPYSASTLEGIEEVFPQGEFVKLFRSYRSTWEIVQFCLRIVPNPNLVALERHGEEPRVLGFESANEEMEAIIEMIKVFKASGNQSLGIVCKTQQQTNMVYQKIKDQQVHLLSPDSTSFSDGVIVVNAHLAKGLEFDEVIVPFASDQNYQSNIDRHMMYIACTRAMHRLTLTFAGERSRFLASGF